MALACLVVASGLLVVGKVGTGQAGTVALSLFRPTPKPVAFAGSGVPISRTSEVPVASGADGGLSATLRAMTGPPVPPRRLVIPALGVNAEIEAVADDAQGRMAAPSRPDLVGWYQPGSMPGDSGNAVLDGHLDWTSGPGVFLRLAKLSRGDQLIVVRTDGTQLNFVVDSTVVFPFDARPQGLFSKTGPPALALVTCSGPWDRQRGTYVDRLIVHATLAPPGPPEPPGDEGG